MTVKKDIDKRRLKEAFFRSYDGGRVADLFVKLAAGRQVPGLSLIGEGMHFRCWREKKAGRDLDLVLKVASPEFLSEIGNIRAWTDSLAKMPVDIELMPPIAMVPLKVGMVESIGIAMPFGPDDADRCSDWWQPMTDLVAAFKGGAKLGGLVLGDIPQIRCWDGIPFMIDISDLRAL